MVCERLSGEEAGWDICETCKKLCDVPLSDLLRDGRAVVIQSKPLTIRVLR